MELDLNNFSRQRLNAACIVVKFLSTRCNLTSLSEGTAAFSQRVRAWSDRRKSQRAAWGKPEQFSIPYLHFMNNSTQGRILQYAKSFSYINNMPWRHVKYEYKGSRWAHPLHSTLLI